MATLPIPNPLGWSALALCCLIGRVTAQAAENSRTVPREVVLLTSTHADDPGDEHANAEAHFLLQMPLNHLGLVVRMQPLAGSRPEPVDPEVTRAVLVHLTGAEPTLPTWLWPWLEAQAEHPDLRFVHLGALEPLRLSDPARFERWFARRGLRVPPPTTSNPLRIGVDNHGGEGYPAESPPLEQRHCGPLSPPADDSGLGIRPWLTTTDLRFPEQTRDPIATAPWGGWALAPWLYYAGSGVGDRRWHLDLFEFFAEALGTKGLPAADPCVAFGRRMLVFHVDGDGFESLTTVEPGTVAAKVFADRVAGRLRIPMTLSIIVRSLTDDLQVDDPSPHMQLARELFALPWVEPATHTVLHPLDWRRKRTPRTLPRTVTWYDELANYDHTMLEEVAASVRFIDQHLTPANKPCRVVLWSGLANPTAEVVRRCRELGCVNLNGGTYRWDDAFDSVGYVAPWGVQRGDTFQVYCGAANENVFDGFYTTTPRAFGLIDETIRRTGGDRILKPANVYAHFYSAEHQPRLEALVALLEEWVNRRPTIPVFASTYAGAVLDAQDRVRIASIPGGFRFDGVERCRTARFDDPIGSVDWHRSPGVVGANSRNGSLYLTLAEQGGEMRWALEPVQAPHLIEADHALLAIERNERSMRWISRGWRPRTARLGGWPAESTVEIRIGDRVLTQTTTAEGGCAIQVDAPGDVPIEVRLP